MKIVNANSDKWTKEGDTWWYHFKNGVKTRGKLVKCELDGCPNYRLTIPSRKEGRVFCSKKCSGNAPERTVHKGFKHYNWNGGRVNAKGYIRVYCPEHPHAVAGKYVLEHRLIMEQKLGRHLEPYERVHHKNGIKDDNRPENLALVTEQIHIGEVSCPHCQKTFFIK